MTFTQEIIDLLRAEAPSKSAKELAELVGSTPQTIYVICHRNGIHIKKPYNCKTIRTNVHRNIRLELDYKALELGVTIETLVRKIITIVVKDKLIDAILEPDEESMDKLHSPYKKLE